MEREAFCVLRDPRGVNRRIVVLIATLSIRPGRLPSLTAGRGRTAACIGVHIFCLRRALVAERRNWDPNPIGVRKVGPNWTLSVVGGFR